MDRDNMEAVYEAMDAMEVDMIATVKNAVREVMGRHEIFAHEFMLGRAFMFRIEAGDDYMYLGKIRPRTGKSPIGEDLWEWNTEDVANAAFTLDWLREHIERFGVPNALQEYMPRDAEYEQRLQKATVEILAKACETLASLVPADKGVADGGGDCKSLRITESAMEKLRKKTMEEH